MKCPRCGGDMSGGVCSSCGFPVTRRIMCCYRYSVFCQLEVKVMICVDIRTV